MEQTRSKMEQMYNGREDLNNILSSVDFTKFCIVVMEFVN